MSQHFRSQISIAVAGAAIIIALLVSGAEQLRSAQSRIGGGTFVEAMVGAPRYVNPLLAASETDLDLVHLVYSGLTRAGSHDNIEPELAEAWASSPDARVFTFTLKPGLRWQDGEPLTADDVLYTVDLVKDAKFPGDPALAARWRNVQIAAPNRQTVIFTLQASDASFVAATTLGLLPAHLWGNIKAADLPASELNRSPVGSGPWRLVRDPNATRSPTITVALAVTATPAGNVTPGLPATSIESTGLMLEPNPFASEPGPRLGRIWFRPYPNFGAALSGFRAGEVHGLAHIPPERVAEVGALRGVSIHRQTLARYSMLLYNLRSSLFDRAEVRRALDMAINRDALVSGPLGGLARAAHSPVLPHSWAYPPGEQNRPRYDPTEARRLLDTAGWTTGAEGIRAREGVSLTLVLVANSDVPVSLSVARSVQEDLRSVGVDAQLAAVGRDTLVNSYLRPLAFHMLLTTWEAGGADPDVSQYWHSAGTADTGILNYAGWSNSEADRALEGALATSDLAERKSHYADFQRIFAEDPPAAILYNPLYVYATRSPAAGVSLPPGDLLGGAGRFDTLRDWSIEVHRLP